MGVWDWLKKTFGGGPTPPTPAAAPSPGAPPTPGKGKPPAAPAGRSYAANPEILGLSAEETRRRSLKIDPMRTAWIGRVDTIPPQSNERTALIDRGLILAGRLSEAELAEIHEVGDLWIRHRGHADRARMAGQAAAAAAVAERAAERAAVKAKKKEEAAQRRAARAEAIAARRASDIGFLGRGVSTTLHDRRSDVERLVGLGLPVLATPRDVAELLGLSVPRLRWLAFHADAARRTHYVSFPVKKRSGGIRRLSAPHRTLKAAQRKILTLVLEKLDAGPSAHGFVKGRSTVTNARPHVGQSVVLNLDLEDFFPSITFPRVRGLFRSLGYSPAVATVLALLTTEAPRELLTYQGERWHVATGPRALPQGAPTSPAIANLVARKLDRRLLGLAASAGWVYTRYADDLTLSTRGEPRKRTPWVYRQVKEIVAGEGFRVHPRKGRVQRAGGRQTVTGVVVNQRLGLPREEVRRLRAILHRARSTGLAAQNRDGRPDFAAYLRGKLAYLSMIDPARGARLLAELDRLEGRPG